MDSLPNELLIQIASQFDLPAPSVVKFRHSTNLELTSSDFIPLKCLSQVSWRWRKIVLPILFTHTRIALDPEPRWVHIRPRHLDDMQDQLAKLSSHELTIYTKLRSEVKDRPEFAYENRFDESMDILHRIQDGDNYLKSVENLLWLPDLPEAFTQLVRLVSQHRLKHCIKSVVVYTDQEYDEYDFSLVDELLNNAVEEIWSQVFSLAEPRRIVVVAPPSTMTSLLDTSIMCPGAWANLSAEFHYVELLQSEPLPPEHRATSCRPGDSMIIHRRPWYHLGFNTGWSYHRLGMYDNVLDCSPEVFYGILSCFTDKAQDCCTITSFDFTSVFPTDDYIDRLILTLHCIPTLRHISIQLAPGLEDDRFFGGNHRDRRQNDKFWYVWRHGHDTLARQLRELDFPDGLVFCSRDHEAEHLEVGREVGIEVGRGVGMEVDQHTLPRRKWRPGWRKEGKGRWVRDRGLDVRH